MKNIFFIYTIGLPLLFINMASHAQLPTIINLETMDVTTGSKIGGQRVNDAFASSISNIGDFNNDGIDDIVIGSPGVHPNGTNSLGRAHIFYGREEGLPSPIDFTYLNGVTGFSIQGELVGDRLGTTVSNAGDLNNDGISDIAITSITPSINNVITEGYTYIIFGINNFTSSSFNLSHLNGFTGFKIIGEVIGDKFGYSIASIGDINGDNIDDIVIGAPDAEGFKGAAYIIFGSESKFSSVFDVSTLNGTNGFKISGLSSGDNLGLSVSNIGDLNGDGFNDVVIGSEPTSIGKAYIIFGTDQGFANVFDLTNLNGSNGFSVESGVSGDRLGTNVSSAGDFNNDGFDDVLISAILTSSASGQIYVIFGTNQQFSSTFDLQSLDGTNGFQIRGASTFNLLGSSTSNLGDVNGDFIDDLLVGAENRDSNGNDNAGTCYVLFGSSETLFNNFNLSNIDGNNGIIVNGIARHDLAGSVVSKAGDINNDGVNDIFIAAPGADPNGNGSGESYVIYGVDHNLIFMNGFE
jgi:hypothetical protein